MLQEFLPFALDLPFPERRLQSIIGGSPDLERFYSFHTIEELGGCSGRKCFSFWMWKNYHHFVSCRRVLTALGIYLWPSPAYYLAQKRFQVYLKGYGFILVELAWKISFLFDFCKTKQSEQINIFWCEGKTTDLKNLSVKALYEAGGIIPFLFWRSLTRCIDQKDILDFYFWNTLNCKKSFSLLTFMYGEGIGLALRSWNRS